MVGMGSSSSSMSGSFSGREWPPLPMQGDFMISPRLSHLLHNHNHLGILVHSSIKKLTHLRHAPRMKDVWCRGLYPSKEIDVLQLSSNAFVSPYSSCLYFFNGGEKSKNLGNQGTSNLGTSGQGSSSKRKWTDVLLTANILIHVAQVASQGKLLIWGAKINPLIEKGQVWRLVTSAFLHAGLPHLMINCYSLNNVGPAIETISGPRRFLAVYFTSALAGSAMSYWFNKRPSVGASGAIFGLVGSLAVFHMRHRDMFRDSEKDLRRVAEVILLNMGIGLVVKSIDNWAHLGGFLGGAAASWFLGPAWKYYLSYDGERCVVDTAPVCYLLSKKET